MNERHYVAEHAVSRVFRAYISKLEQIDEEYMSQRADDLRDLERRIINNLHGIRPVKLENLDTPVVLVSRSLTPSETASLPKGKIIGIATDLGGQASHASILSRAMEIPAVVGLKAITLHVSSGDVVVIDGTRGEVVISPDEKTLQKYRLLKRNFDFQQHIADVYRDRPVRTMDEGDPVDVTVLANVEKAEDIPRAFERGASGIGLFRTEYLLLNRPIWPDEEEQFATYLKALELADGRTLVFRTFDIDADKMPEKQAIYREEIGRASCRERV